LDEVRRILEAAGETPVIIGDLIEK
jgi:hypothetical protein